MLREPEGTHHANKNNPLKTNDREKVEALALAINKFRILLLMCPHTATDVSAYCI